MEANGAFGIPKRTWRQRLGLQTPPPDPDAWVKVASYVIDNEHGSRSAARAVAKLNHAGIQAQQHSYVLPDQGAMHLTGPPSAVNRLRIAVLVHDRDRLRATELLRPPPIEPISDEELARQSGEAYQHIRQDQPDGV